jgi:RNA polymerase sigma-70 factor (ECF subfamily)
VADEAVAEAFAQLLRRGRAVVDPEAWAWRAAFRIAGGELARRRASGLVAEVPEVGAGDPWLPPLAAELVAALATLSDQQRACVALRDVGGLGVAEVAAALGTSAGTVRVQHLKGRRRLRQLLGGDDG